MLQDHDHLPPLNALRAFEAAGRLLSFRAAAEELGVTQSAVAQQIRLLEDRLGLSLFGRHPRGVTLTDPGRSYHRAVSDSFTTLRQATARLRPAPERVSISVTPTFASKWLIPRLPDLTNALPCVDLQVVATERVTSFQADRIDLAVRQGTPPFPAALRSTRLFRLDIIAVCAPHLMATEDAWMEDGQFLGQTRLYDSHGLWDRYLACAYGRHALDHAAPGLQFSQTTLCLDAALAGQGIALTARALAARDLDAGRLVQPVPQRMVEDGGFYLLAPRRISDSAEAVRAWLIQRAEPED